MVTPEGIDARVVDNAGVQREAVVAAGPAGIADKMRVRTTSHLTIDCLSDHQRLGKAVGDRCSGCRQFVFSIGGIEDAAVFIAGGERNDRLAGGPDVCAEDAAVILLAGELLHAAWADIRWDRDIHLGEIARRIIPGLRIVDAIRDRGLFQKRQDERRPGVEAAADLIIAGRKTLLGLLVVRKRQAHLLEIVGALHLAASLAGPLDRRQQQANQRPDNGEYREQFDECKTTRCGAFGGGFHGCIPRGGACPW